MVIVKLRAHYDEDYKDLVWHVAVNDVTTLGFVSVWDAIVAGLDLLEDREEKLDYLWDISTCLAALYGGAAILYYKQLMDMIGEK